LRSARSSHAGCATMSSPPPITARREFRYPACQRIEPRPIPRPVIRSPHDPGSAAWRRNRPRNERERCCRLPGRAFVRRSRRPEAPLTGESSAALARRSVPPPGGA
jgi:hypothetical protein